MSAWLRNLGITLLAVVLIAAGAYRFVDVAVTESYSSEWTAESSAAAAAEGRLRARPVVATPLVQVEGHALRVADLWVEQAYHVEHPLLLWRRVVLDSTYRILMRLEQPGGATASLEVPSFDAGWPTFNETGRFTTRSTELWSGSIAPPFPDTVRVAFPRAASKGT